MACQSCRRQLLQLARQANTTTPVATELYSAALATRLFQRVAIGHVANEQRRCFRSTPTQHGLLDSLRNAIGNSTEPYKVVAATQDIYNACSKAAPYKIDPIAIKADTIPKTAEGEHIGEGQGMWHVDFKLLPTFSTWSQVTMLHMYLIFARLRNLDRDAAKTWQAQLVDHFFFDAEERMDVNHGITSRGLRSKYLKDMFVQWRGIIMAYDEGVVKGDAVLASAVWRNVFKAREDVSVRDLAAIVSWMRLGLKMLDQMPDNALFTRATTALRWPAKNEFAVVDRPTSQLEGRLGRSSEKAASA